MDNGYVQIRLKNLQRELRELEKHISHSSQKTVGKTRLKGLWKGIDISEDDIRIAKKSLFKDLSNQDI
jgi:hypothetical protein